MQAYLGAPDSGIHPIPQHDSSLRGIYTLDGHHVTHLHSLTPGIYIVDGKLRFLGDRE